MKQDDNIGTLIIENAESYPDLLSIVTDNSIMNYRDFSKAILSVAHRLRSAGIGPDKIVCQQDEDLISVATVLSACALLGATWVSSRVAQHLPIGLTPTLHLTSQATGRDTGQTVLDPSWFTGDALRMDEVAKTRASAPLAYVATSGTTGSPKVIAISYQQQILRAHATKEDFVPRKTVFSTLFRASAYPYITRFLSAFANGATIVDSQSPDVWYSAGLNHLYGSVAQLSEFMGAVSLPKKLPLVHVSGSRLSDGLARQLIENFDTVIDLYASTETNRSFKNQKCLGEGGRIETHGIPLDSEVQIVDPDGKPVPNMSVGNVRVRNAYLVDGYLSHPEATKNSFRDGWFYTGDVGKFGHHGELIVLGRTGDILNLGGVKINAAEVDDALRTLPSVKDAMCFDVPTDGGPNELLAFVVLQPDATMTEVAEQCERMVLPAIGKARLPRRLIQIGAVPRAHDGGAQRFMCRKIYAGG